MTPRVLIADDSETILLLIRTRLEMAGYDVETAIDGQEVMEAVHRDPKSGPDILLLDAMMPRKSGIDALRELRAEGIDTPALIVSAHQDGEDAGAVLAGTAEARLAADAMPSESSREAAPTAVSETATTKQAPRYGPYARGKKYNVCRGEAYRIGDLLQALLSLASVGVEVRTDPSRMRPSDHPVVLGSHDRLTRDTGWTPTIPIERTLADALDYWRAH